MTTTIRRTVRWLIPSKDSLSEVLAIAVIVFVTLVATFPLVLHLGDRIPGWPGDNLYFYWELAWFKRALFDLHTLPFVSYELYSPVGLELARDEMTPANTVLGLPLTAVAGPAVAYNLLTLGSLVLSGYAVYGFIFGGTGSRLAGLVGGLAFAIAPYRMAHLAGHLNLIATQWLALSLLFVQKLFRSRRPRDGALAGAWFGLNALAAWYYLYIGTLAVAVFIAVRAWPWRDALRDRRLWYGAAMFVVVAGALVVPFALPYLALRETGVLQRSFAQLDGGSASPTDFLQPNPLHPIWGAAMRAVFPSQWQVFVERTLSLGWVLMALAAIGVWSWRHDRTAQALAVLVVVSAIVALGPTLHWQGQRVEFALPAGVVRLAEQSHLTAALERWVDPSLAAAVRAGRGFIPLLALPMYVFVPLTSSMRAIVRSGMVTMLAVAVLGGYGAAALLHTFKGQKRNVLALATCSLVMFELWSQPPEWTYVQPRPVDVWLAAQPGQSVLVEFPAIDNFSPVLLLYQTVNRQKMVAGPGNLSFRPPILFERGKQLTSFPSADSLVALREWNTRYILVTPTHFARTSDWQSFQSRLAALSGVKLVGDMGGVLVYEIE